MAIHVVPVVGLLTAYRAATHSRAPNADGSLARPEELALSDSSVTASPATAADLVALDRAMVDQGGARLRIVQVHRDQREQARLRQLWETWDRAGRPDPSSRARFSPSTMSTAYAALPGESNHGWGGAVDIQVQALAFPGVRPGTDAALAKFWELAASCGFHPVIAAPHAGQSEAWHFDHLGALAPIRTMFASRGRHDGGRFAAIAGNAIAGTYLWPDGQSMARVIQARLLLAGFWCGPIDGVLGKTTRLALNEAGIPATARTPSEIITALNEAGIATRIAL